MKRWMWVIGIIALTAVTAVAQDELSMSEEDLFSDAETVMTNTNKIINDTIASNADKESVKFSGQIMANTGYSMTRDWVRGIATGDSNRVSLETEADLLLDVRLRKGIRAYVDFYLGYNPAPQVDTQSLIDQSGISDDTNLAALTNYLNPTTIGNATQTVEGDLSTEILLKEVFIDANISRVVYFRGGKQVLQWGRGYLWTPTDLINTQKKSFLDMDYLREGTYGLKVHIPYQTLFNFYGFVDATDVEKFNDFAVAGKLEFLLGRVEFAFSGWAKKNYLPEYGFDFATRLGKFNIWGEMGISYGENRKHIDEMTVDKIIVQTSITNSSTNFVTNYTTYQNWTGWYPRISLGFSRSFDWKIQDRIMLSFEFFYNHSGDVDKMLADESKRNYLLMNGMYEPNYFAMYYAGLFFTLQQFFVQDLNFAFNVMGNLNDWSFTAMASWSYTPVYNFNMALNLISYLGEDGGEYTMAGNALTVQFVTTLSF